MHVYGINKDAGKKKINAIVKNVLTRMVVWSSISPISGHASFLLRFQTQK